MPKKVQALRAKVAVKSEGPKKSKNPEVALSDKEAKTVDRYSAVVHQFKELEEEKNLLSGEVRGIGQRVFAARAAEGKFENPRLVGNESSALFVVQNAFSAVSEDRKAVLESHGLGSLVEQGPIVLRSDLDEATQEKILQALVKVMGQDLALSFFTTTFRIKSGAVEEYARKNPDQKKILEALLFLEPRQQVRTS